ncbi:hypothetical protein CPB84DRAFT_1820384 [Gymnopilus junonius]|uniref:AB hydrolase-1 domain-containing protein n=1 Tax=Gymnopilus junonius TaxID=109634 RepID=A0A9P5P072_GYMJU|nr:hypothetical protein CPB84DRAFT_1820384 [Gymnopilus junonius]
MAARCELIDDLVPLILDAIDSWWPRDLVALSTLSSTWLFFIRKRLYAYPTLQSFSAIRLLARTLSGRTHLTSLVRGLDLQPMIETPYHRPLPEELSGLRLLLSLEGIQRLTLGGELSIKADRFLRLMPSPETVEELHIDGSLLSNKLSCCPSLEWDESLSFGLANLSKLRLTEVEVDIHPPSIPFPSAINRLILEHVNVVSGYLPHLLNGSQSLELLQVTTNEWDTSIDQLGLVLASCTVKWLQYETRKDHSGNFIFNMSSSSTEALRCLHLKGLVVDSNLLTFLRDMCRNLVELVVSGRGIRVSPGEWVEFIDLGALPCLGLVGLPLGTNYPPWTEKDSREIEEACAMQSILSRHSSASHRTPRKSTSFLSLHREKDKSDASCGVAGPSSHSRDTSAPIPSPPKIQSMTFPQQPLLSIPATPGPAQEPVLQKTPPRTPDDYTASSDSLDFFPVVVAAPVAGVETMDALVDGMNGRDGLSSRTSSTRSRFAIPGHHPLYQPPLPTPPPGVILGGGKARPKLSRQTSASGDSSDEQDPYRSLPTPRTRRRRVRPTSSRTPSTSTITPPSTSPLSGDDSISHFGIERTQVHPRPNTSPSTENRKSIVPSISEIIRNHAPPEARVRSRPTTARSSSLYSPSTQGHATVHEEAESEPDPLAREEDDAEFLSRSSIDSVADEVRRTIRNQNMHKAHRPTPPPPSSSAHPFLKRQSTISDNNSIYSPRSDPGAASIYSVSAPSSYVPPSPFEAANFLSMVKNSPSQAVAQYLRSARLTTLLKLTRSPHASQDNPLTVSLSDLGNPTGFPIVVFLGLGCVRHIMGLYDEMASCMGLRLITIDRWGLGRTEPRSKSSKGIMQWASVVEEVLDLLRIDQCSIMAHSAGAPYALSFANKSPYRIRGDICLLAPWVGGSESNGYKWLKYVPNSILKTAQAAEWKIQAWMIGKPPTLAYEGIGYTAPAKSTKDSPSRPSDNAVYPSGSDTRPRPSVGSGSFSEYDDLRDFDGRFESKSTLGLTSRTGSQTGKGGVENAGVAVAKRKPSRGILERLKGSPTTTSASTEKQPPSRKLKGLRSMGSLKGKGQAARASEPSSPQLPPALQIDVGLGLEDLSWSASVDPEMRDLPTATPQMRTNGGSLPRSSGRRSISFTSTQAPASIPGSPSPGSFTTTFTQSVPATHQAALGNALIAASHAESAKGTHNDLLQILNHENHSWGFSYSSYPHRVRIWYGDRDEKIAENAVRGWNALWDQTSVLSKS